MPEFYSEKHLPLGAFRGGDMELCQYYGSRAHSSAPLRVKKEEARDEKPEGRKIKAEGRKKKARKQKKEGRRQEPLAFSL
jgi:hypothetical protein